jgi:PleD family two-component response regulator
MCRLAKTGNCNSSLALSKYRYYYKFHITDKVQKKIRKITKILVIEDENLVRATVLEILESRNFEAVDALNGRVGIQIATAQIPDKILKATDL